MSNSTTPPNAAPASSSSCTTSRPASPRTDLPKGVRSCRPRSPGCPTRATCRRSRHRRPPCRRPAPEGASTAAGAHADADKPRSRSMTVDLTPYIDAVPDARRRADPRRADGSSRSATRTPMPTRSGRRSASSGSSRPRWRRPIRSAPTCRRRLQLPRRRSTGSGPTRTPTADYDLLVISDCGALDRIGEVGGRHAELFERLPRVVIDHHASNDGAGEADWIDPAAAATCEMVALLATRLGVPLDIDGGASRPP